MTIAFTPSERRALYFLVALLIVASGVKIYQRYYPDTGGRYSITIDTALAEAAPAVNNAAERKLAAGIDPNAAPQEDLELLPGIGPSLAQAIIAEREEHGAFKDAADLKRVPGIGTQKIEQLRGHLRFP